MNTNSFTPCEHCEPEPSDNFPPFPPKPPQTTECTQVAFQYADISIPLEISPDTDIGKIESECCGEPFIRCEQCDCDCERGSGCNIIITQSVKIKIPVKFGIRAVEGKEYIRCNDCD